MRARRTAWDSRCLPGSRLPRRRYHDADCRGYVGHHTGTHKAWVGKTLKPTSELLGSVSLPPGTLRNSGSSRRAGPSLRGDGVPPSTPLPPRDLARRNTAHVARLGRYTEPFPPRNPLGAAEEVAT